MKIAIQFEEPGLFEARVKLLAPSTDLFALPTKTPEMPCKESSCVAECSPIYGPSEPIALAIAS